MKLRDNIAWMVDEKESLLVNHQSNHGLVLDGTGNKIIRLVSQGFSRNEIIESMIQKYTKSDFKTITDDIEHFLAQLIDNGFIEEDSHGFEKRV